MIYHNNINYLKQYKIVIKTYLSYILSYKKVEFIVKNGITTVKRRMLCVE